MFYNPALILMTPFSGSTLVAKLFAAHGCHGGELQPNTDERHPDGCYENIHAKAFAGVFYGCTNGKANFMQDQNHMGLPLPGFREQVVERSMGIDYSKPWFVKHRTEFWPMWWEFDPWFVLVRRDRASTIASLMGCAQYPHQAKMMYERGATLLDALERWFPGRTCVVNTPRLIDGDYTEIAAAIEGYGLQFDPETTRNIVKPELWHHSA